MSDLNSTGNEPRTDLEIFSWGYDERLSWLGAAWECADNGHYYELPVNQEDLIGLLRVGVHHSSALHCKLNVLTSTFEPTKLLSRAEFKKLAFNFLVTGNGYLSAERNRFGKVLGFKNRLSVYMRRSSKKLRQRRLFLPARPCFRDCGLYPEIGYYSFDAARFGTGDLRHPRLFSGFKFGRA